MRRNSIVRAYVILVLIALILSVPLAVSAQNNDDDAEFRPPMMDNGDRVEDQFAAESNAKLYAFLASEGDRAMITMTQVDENSDLDPYLVLFNSAGQVIAFDDDGGPEPFSAQIQTRPVPDDDLYFILATERVGIRFSPEDLETSQQQVQSNARAFNLRLEGINMPEDVDELVPIFDLIDIGDAVEVDITERNPVIYLFFDGLAGDTVTVTTSDVGDDVDTILYLFDPNGVRIAVNDDGENSPGFYSQIVDAELERDGAYLIIATAYSYQNTASPDEEWDGGGRILITVE